jgi:hypothetical protein
MVLEKLGFEAEADGRLNRTLQPGDLTVDFLTIEA